METLEEVIEKKTMIAIVADANGVDYIRQARIKTPGVATSIHYMDTNKASALRLAEVFEDIHSKCISQVFSDQKRQERITHLAEFFIQHSDVATPVIIGTDQDYLTDFWANARRYADGNPIVYSLPELEATPSAVRAPSRVVAEPSPILRPVIA